MMKFDVDSTEPDVRVELVPLIDVIFCILTFFIVAAVTLTRQAAINVDLPSAKTGTTQMRQILVVSIDPIGQTYVEKDPVTQSQLTDALVKFRKESPEGLMVLYASRASSYNDVVRVLDLLRSVGGTRVALATLPGSGQVDQFPVNPSGGLLNPSTLPGLTNPASPSGVNPNSLNPNSLNQNLQPGVAFPSGQPTGQPTGQPNVPGSSNSPSSKLNPPSTQPGASSLPLPSGAGQTGNQPNDKQ